MRNSFKRNDQSMNLDKEFFKGIRRRNIGGNFAGMVMCTAYYSFIDTVQIVQGLDAVVVGTLLFFAFQAAFTSFHVGRHITRIPPLLEGDEESKKIAQRMVLNMPYLCCAASLGNWMVAALVVPILVVIFEAGEHQPFFALRMFMGIMYSGLLTGAVVFFRVEGYCRKIWPVVFPEGGMARVKGAWRLNLRTRMAMSLVLTGIFPTLMLATVTYNRTRLMLQHDPEMLLETLLAVILFILTGCGFVTLIVSRMVSRSIIGPLQDMERAIKHVKKGNLDVTVPLTSNDELGTLGESFNTMVNVLKDRERMAAMEVEMEQGRRIQQDFLPKDLVEIPGWEISATFFPARQVSGDFYDAFKLPDGKVAFVIADVCDKGVGSALFMALFRSLIRVYSLQLGDDACGVNHNHDNPTQSALFAVSHTNDYIATVHEEHGMFATAFLGVLDPLNGDLFYVNAGHEPPILAGTDGTFTSLKPTGPAAGLRPGVEFGHATIRMAPGDLLFGYTDGVTDARNEYGEAFLRERVEKIMNSGISSAEGVTRALESKLFDHMGAQSQFDDITMIALRREP